MKDKRKQPLQIAIHGMDGRSLKMMVMFLQGPCKGAAVVVQENEAEVEIIDADATDAKSLLNARKQQHPERPIILLSLQEQSLENVIFVKKPVQTSRMLAAIEQAKNDIVSITEKKVISDKIDSVQPQKKLAGKVDNVDVSDAKEKLKEKKVLNADEQKKTSKHKTAMQLDEKGFISLIGISSGINYNDPEQIKTASYTAKDYFQGFVQSAFKLSLTKNRIIKLNSGWKPVTIFPHSHEVWVDADDKQLRAFASIPINSITSAESQGITVTPVDPKKENFTHGLEKFQSMDAFLWKLVIWTSKGRFPDDIDLDRPVYLKRWPNLTRLVVTPHAMRIAAILMEGPRTLTNVAKVLNINPQYVFVFFSAVHAMGLAGQAERKADLIVAPPPAPVRGSEKKGLLTSIIRTLRGTKN